MDSNCLMKMVLLDLSKDIDSIDHIISTPQ